MAGTKIGGLKAAQRNKQLHGQNFYKRIGSKGGSAPTKYPKGFAADRELASRAGTIGGRISRRGKPLSTVKYMDIITT